MSEGLPPSVSYLRCVGATRLRRVLLGFVSPNMVASFLVVVVVTRRTAKICLVSLMSSRAPSNSPQSIRSGVRVQIPNTHSCADDLKAFFSS